MKPFVKIRTSKTKRRKPRILICTPEITELSEGMGNAAMYIRAKGGGLGDISAGLIRYLYRDSRFQLHVALPKYDNQIRGRTQIGPRELDLLAPILDRKGIHLVADSAFCYLDDVYDEEWAHPRVHRAVAFQRHIINYLLDSIRPDVVHCNDWMTGLVPPAAAEKGIKSLFTLHNVFTEKETPLNIDRAGIDVRRFMEHLYFEQWPDESMGNWAFNKIDFAASGIQGASLVNTVSETFLQEIVNNEFPGIVPQSISRAVENKYKASQALGIQNAPNDSVDPRVSSNITPYDVDDVMESKRINKKELQRKMGLSPNIDAPLFFWPSRLYPQKGPALLQKIIEPCVKKYGIQVAFVANGDTDMEIFFQAMNATTDGYVSRLPFNEELSELGKAGSDFILMPSMYEPCGLPQMECPRFGTLPVARLTGGIRDTVWELDMQANTGNGFVFEEFSHLALQAAIERAVAFYQLDEAIKEQQIQRIMKESFEKFTLENTAEKYIQVYESLIGEE